ncbi:hypothetical protein BCR34DRAFT_487023 [Clohesyomyces aquaticus]|uniref:Uncharacterized protein n=1 Tax=Clohesyomyces aquaticus TaxID=1231657 RepID=A0A1Y1ZHF0_9PLEO|nr:hypothetical protein BCR34DRAFT_487023 [Clohesyomyces aquaticus]
MRFFQAPSAVLSIIALLALVPSALAKPYPVHVEEFRELHNASQLEPRQQCAGTPCGYGGWLCCPSGSACYIDAANQAQCGAPSVTAAGGSWQYYTSTWVETGYVTRTSVYSTYVGATAQATPTDCGVSRQPCGGSCCDGGYWCKGGTQCVLIAGGTSGGIVGTLTPSAPLRPTSSGLIIVTATGTPTATIPFETPIATGVNGTMVPVAGGGGGGLSGGAIAGIVIGVILGILLLLLICLFCCARALFDTVMAIFGLGKKRRHTHEETYIEEHHHSSGGGGGGRRWYGQGPSRPSRKEKKSSGLGGALGVGALLGGLGLALGLKRKHDRKHDDKSTTVSGSTGYYSSEYTSSSSASSSDRHTRHTRHSSRR